MSSESMKFPDRIAEALRGRLTLDFHHRRRPFFRSDTSTARAARITVGTSVPLPVLETSHFLNNPDDRRRPSFPDLGTCQTLAVVLDVRRRRSGGKRRLFISRRTALRKRFFYNVFTGRALFLPRKILSAATAFFACGPRRQMAKRRVYRACRDDMARNVRVPSRQYSNQLWWRFAFSADAPRFLRASLGASMLFVSLCLFLWLRPSPFIENFTPSGRNYQKTGLRLYRLRSGACVSRGQNFSSRPNWIARSCSQKPGTFGYNWTMIRRAFSGI